MHLSKMFIYAINALTYDSRGSSTYKYIFEERETVKFDLFLSMCSIFLPTVKQEP